MSFLGQDPRKKWLRAAALLLAAIALLYEVGANVLLSTHAIAHLVSEHPERLRLEYASARSVWPGRVRVRGLDLRGRSAKVEWALHVDVADVDISLFALLRRRFRVGALAATGVAFRARLREEADELSADRAARLPPIEGFDALPIAGVPPEPTEAHAPWLIDLQGVDAQGVREVWIDAFRLAGMMRAKGGFTLDAGRLAVAPSTADVDSVALTTGEDAVVTEVTGSLGAEMDLVDLREVHGAAVLRSLSMQSALHGSMGSIRFLRHFVQAGSLELAGGTGKFRSEAHVVHGRVEAGTSSQLELEPATVRLEQRTIEGRVRIELTDEGRGDPAGAGPASPKLDVSVADLTLREPNAKTVIRCPSLTTSVHAAPVDLAEPLSVTKDLAYSWDTPHVEWLDLHAIDDVIPREAPFHIEHGAGTMSARGRGTLLGASAEVGLDGTLAMRIWGAPLSSGVRGTVPLKASFVARTLELTGAELALSDPALAGWWGKIALGATTIHFDPAALSLAASATAHDGRPFLSFYAAMHDSSPVTDTALAVVPDPLIEAMTANLHGSLRLSAKRGAVDLEGMDVQGASSRLRGALARRGERMDGGLLVEAGPTTLGIAFVAGKTSLVLLQPTKWFETSVASKKW